MQKQLICPERVREVPRQFSWVDQRLVREGLMRGQSAEALSLYLFLLVVGDNQGLSYYSDSSVCSHLSLTPVSLKAARAQLDGAGFIAYQKPLYQVLSLDKIHEVRRKRGSGELTTIAQILAKAAQA